MRDNSNKKQVNKPTVKIHDSSASDAADPYPGSDHVGGTRCSRGANLGWRCSAAHLACWAESFLGGKTRPGFLFPVLVGIARGKSSIKQCFSRYVSFATHVKLCACWEEFLLSEKLGRVFSS